MDKEFYKNLAYLFYAVANADKNFKVEEKKKIVAFTKRYFSTEIETEQSSDVIYEVMRESIKAQLSSELAYEQFAGYYQTNKKHFTKEIIRHILITCHEIADAFAGKNKSELILLARIQALINKEE